MVWSSCAATPRPNPRWQMHSSASNQFPVTFQIGRIQQSTFIHLRRFSHNSTAPFPTSPTTLPPLGTPHSALCESRQMFSAHRRRCPIRFEERHHVHVIRLASDTESNPRLKSRELMCRRKHRSPRSQSFQTPFRRASPRVLPIVLESSERAFQITNHQKCMLSAYCYYLHYARRDRKRAETRARQSWSFLWRSQSG